MYANSNNITMSEIALTVSNLYVWQKKYWITCRQQRFMRKLLLEKKTMVDDERAIQYKNEDTRGRIQQDWGRGSKSPSIFTTLLMIRYINTSPLKSPLFLSQPQRGRTSTTYKGELGLPIWVGLLIQMSP